jgi:hypothetical protein
MIDNTPFLKRASISSARTNRRALSPGASSIPQLKDNGRLSAFFDKLGLEKKNRVAHPPISLGYRIIPKVQGAKDFSLTMPNAAKQLERQGWRLRRRIYQRFGRGVGTDKC